MSRTNLKEREAIRAALDPMGGPLITKEDFDDFSADMVAPI